MKVLVTRAEPAASRTAEKLKLAGHEPIVMPLSALTDTGNPLSDGNFDGYIFTSANAPRILKARGWANTVVNMPAFCVGQKTADAAKRIGFEICVIADGGGARLAEEIKNYPFQRPPKLLYPTTPDRQFDMQAALSVHGIEVTNCDIYRMRSVEPSEETFSGALQSVADGAVLAYSTQSAERLLNFVNENSAVEFLQQSSIITISKEVARPFEVAKFQNIYISDVPSEISMFHILDKLGV